MRKLLNVLMVISLIMLLAACGGGKTTSTPAENGSTNSESSADPIKISYAFFSPEKTYPGVVAQKWADQIEAKTNGKVDVEIYFGGTLLDAANMLDGVKNNIADIGLMALSYEPGRFPLEEIAEISRGYSTAEGASQVMNDIIAEYPPDVLKDYEIIKVFTTDAMMIQSTKPISSLDALKGQQIRIGGALTPVLERLGGAPVGMSQAEQAQALQTGIISGFVSDRGNLKEMGFAEYVGYYTDYPVAVTTLVAIMNKGKYDALPDDVKAAIQELKVDMPVVAGQYLDENTKEVIKWSQAEHGLEIVSLDSSEKEKWDSILLGLQDEYVKRANELGLPGDEYVKRVNELIDQYSK